eukprot:1513371-Rhodomonas_salina.2
MSGTGTASAPLSAYDVLRDIRDWESVTFGSDLRMPCAISLRAHYTKPGTEPAYGGASAHAHAAPPEHVLARGSRRLTSLPLALFPPELAT